MIPPLMLMHAEAGIRQKARWYYSPDTYKLSTFYCPSPFIVRGNGKTDSTLAVRRGELLDFLECVQSDGKSQGQINGVVFG